MQILVEPSQALIAALKKRYDESQRHYHTWEHVEALLGHYTSIQSQLHDPTAVLWALYWHDAIYDPQASDNEEKSADLLLEMAPLDLPAASRDLADTIIRATKSHTVPKGLSRQNQADLEYFLDMDLSILAAAPHTFDAYELHIRQEYAFVPEQIYLQARGGILNGFLKRERLYFSDHFHSKWEDTARKNLMKSLKKLETRETEIGES